MQRLTISFFIITLLFTQSIFIFAFETDQFNLSPQPLADIGGEVTGYVISNIEKSVDKLNVEIIVRQKCLDKAKFSENLKCESENKNLQRLAYLRSERAVADEIYNLLGTGCSAFYKFGKLAGISSFHQSAGAVSNLVSTIYFFHFSD